MSPRKPLRGFKFEETGDVVYTIEDFKAFFDLKSVLKSWKDSALLRWLDSLPDKTYAEKLRDVTPKVENNIILNFEALLQIFWADNIPDNIAKEVDEYITKELDIIREDILIRCFSENLFCIIEKIAKQGNAGAQYMLGECYFFGLGVEQDYAEAEKWYRKSAEQGNADAQHMLNEYYK